MVLEPGRGASTWEDTEGDSMAGGAGSAKGGEEKEGEGGAEIYVRVRIWCLRRHFIWRIKETTSSVRDLFVNVMSCVMVKLKCLVFVMC